MKTNKKLLLLSTFGIIFVVAGHTEYPIFFMKSLLHFIIKIINKKTIIENQ